MGFQRLKYELDAGAITRVVLSTDKVAQAGAEPGGAQTIFGWNISATAAKRKRNQRRCRGWLYRYTERTTESDLAASVDYFFPKLTPAAYNATPAEELEFDDRDLEFVDKLPEQ